MSYENVLICYCILATDMQGTFIAPNVEKFVTNDDKETFEDESETKKGA